MIRTIFVWGIIGLMLAGYSKKIFAQSRNAPDWVADAVIYQVFVRAFSPEGTLDAVTERIPEIASLGVNTLYLMPIHPIGQVGRTGSLGSPYSITDFETIDPSLGDEESLHRLIETAHAHGLKVVMDLVINHTALDHPFVKDRPEWYRWNPDGTLMHPDPQWKDVAQLNYDDADLRAYMIEMAGNWVRTFDIDGFRADVSYKIPVSFWLEFRDAMRAIKPELMLLSESDNRPLLLAFDIAYNWTLGDHIQKVARRTQLPSTLLQPVDGPRWMNYLENHDQPRIAALTRDRSTKPFATYLLTMTGVPLIQNGQEIGATERLSLFDPAQIRWERPDLNLRSYYEKLIRIRHDYPQLRRGSLELIGHDPASFVLSYVKAYDGEKVLVVLNFSTNEQRLSLPADLFDPEKAYIDLLTDMMIDLRAPEDDSQNDTNATLDLALQPMQSMIIPLH